MAPLFVCLSASGSGIPVLQYAAERITASDDLAQEGSTKRRKQVEDCLTPAMATTKVDHEACVMAHIYQVVALVDGTRFLDTCPDSQSDDACRFTIISPSADHNEVGDLRRFQGRDVHLRGVIHSIRGRMGIVLSQARQLDAGPEKFRPNPRLLKNFNAQSGRLPFNDSNLKSSGRHRAFMNMSDREPLSRATKP